MVDEDDKRLIQLKRKLDDVWNLLLAECTEQGIAALSVGEVESLYCTHRPFRIRLNRHELVDTRRQLAVGGTLIDCENQVRRVAAQSLFVEQLANGVAVATLRSVDLEVFARQRPLAAELAELAHVKELVQVDGPIVNRRSGTQR